MIQKLKLLLLLPTLILSLGFFIPHVSLAAGSDAGSTFGNGCVNKTEQECLSHNKFIADVRTVVNIASGLVGVIVVGMVILGGIQYSLARDNSNEIGAAQKRIANALIALVLYMLIFGFLQWLIPGGLFA
ncbi:MAG TPA: hypothetical protein VFT49_03375 [Candidatus Saccharimonadales bacterium]|nr:hypothetical protein [Candidatus Saccharimonadales bacterium]